MKQIETLQLSSDKVQYQSSSIQLLKQKEYFLKRIDLCKENNIQIEQENNRLLLELATAEKHRDIYENKYYDIQLALTKKDSVIYNLHQQIDQHNKQYDLLQSDIQFQEKAYRIRITELENQIENNQKNHPGDIKDLNSNTQQIKKKEQYIQQLNKQNKKLKKIANILKNELLKVKGQQINNTLDNVYKELGLD